jgi:hypothetical protein
LWRGFTDRPALVVEYWAAGDRIFASWCGTCSRAGEIVWIARTTSHE